MNRWMHDTDIGIYDDGRCRQVTALHKFDFDAAIHTEFRLLLLHDEALMLKMTYSYCRAMYAQIHLAPLRPDAGISGIKSPLV